MARRDTPAKEKENTEERAKERARGDVLDPVSCVKDRTVLVSVLHIMVERSSVPSHLARDTKNLHRFDKAYPEGNERDWITGGGALAISFPSLQNFANFDLEGKFILDSGAKMSMGGVDLLPKKIKKFTQMLGIGCLRTPFHHFVSRSRTAKKTCLRVFYLFPIRPGG